MSSPHGAARVRATAPAKVNLHLEILGKRDDGYHEVETVLLAIDLADVVEAGLRPPTGSGEAAGVELVGPWATPDVPRDGRNLASRATEAVRRRAQELGLPRARDEVVLRIEKHVPSGAGLGGGSSDAAAATLAASRLYGVDPDDPALLRGLAELGADCAFFLEARATGCAVGRGRGERIEVLAPRAGEWFVALVCPDVLCPTAEVYRGVSVPGRPVPLDLAALGDGRPASLDRARAGLFNRLEQAASRAHPILQRWRDALDGVGAGHFRLSGSGSSFFGLFDDRERAKHALDALAVGAKARNLGLRARYVLRPAGRGAALALGD